MYELYEPILAEKTKSSFHADCDMCWLSLIDSNRAFIVKILKKHITQTGHTVVLSFETKYVYGPKNEE
jgi:hypothetical protein